MKKTNSIVITQYNVFMGYSGKIKSRLFLKHSSGTLLYVKVSAITGIY